MAQGQIIKTYNGYYYLQRAEGQELLSCRLRGRLKRHKGAVVPGDVVEYALLEDGTGIIEECRPRKSLLARPAVANVDQVAVTFAARHPDINELLLNRFLVLAEWSEIREIIICLNKCDLLTEQETMLESYRQAGYKVLPVSAKTGMGIDTLRQQLKGHTTVFAGPSGAGKSSLLNAIDNSFQLATGKISDKIKRGKHTTRAACLLPLAEGGMVVDTPGFSAADLEQIDEHRLPFCFPEFRPYMEKCYYSSCSHSHEPDCGVKAAVAAGEISASRYEAYLNILQGLKQR